MNRIKHIDEAVGQVPPETAITGETLGVATDRRQQLVIDVCERLFTVLLAIPFAAAFIHVLPTRPDLIVIMTSEMLAVVLILTRRFGAISLSPISVLTAFIGTALPLLVRPGGAAVLPEMVSLTGMMGGLILSILSKLYLNRSFGLIAANRGVKIGGPYRFIRHPMYVGYVISQVAFLGGSLSTRNLVIYAIAWAAQLIRVREEERVLLQDQDYRSFAERVRYRFIPGLC